MKNMKYVVVAAFLFFTAGAFAQNNMEDVIYLKNGSVYRGMIIEQVPGVNYKVQIAGGSVFTVTVPEVEKITKEQRYHSPVAAAPRADYDMPFMPPFMRHMRDTSTAPYYLRKRRFFSQIEFRPGLNNVGLRFVHGYKFGRFGFVGIGFGVDAVSFSKTMSTGSGIFDNTQPNNGLYLPLYVHYSGEILRRRITPYYYLEAGYAAHPNNPFAENKGVRSYGGPIGAAGFGVKFYSRKRASFALNLNMNFRSNQYKSTYLATDVFGNSYTASKTERAGKWFGALGLSIGF